MHYIKNLFLTGRLFLLFGSIAVLFVIAFFIPALTHAAKIIFYAAIGLFIIDYILLFRQREPVKTQRIAADRFSNGDNNEVRIFLFNGYKMVIDFEVIDEIPFQFQRRDICFNTRVPSSTEHIITYELRPVKRGEYSFGGINVFARTAIGLVKRRFIFARNKEIKVYPSYIQMRKYELLAASNRLSEVGIKKIRRIGQSMEFEHIREYVQGDDYRSMNWQATARRSQLMINNYQDERSQNVYCIIDKGRVMKMPFNQLTLLDYAINASLVLSNIALQKSDKAGIITFSNKVNNVLVAERKQFQLLKINDLLYNQKSLFNESDYESLYYAIRKNITQRSLIVLFTNFETVRGMERNMKYIRKMAANHLCLVVFFENTELKAIVDSRALSLQEVYEHTIAAKFLSEKKQIIRELNKYGIPALLTPPEMLTANTVNKYLEFKARNMI